MIAAFPSGQRLVDVGKRDLWRYQEGDEIRVDAARAAAASAMTDTFWRGGLDRLLARVEATASSVTEGFPHYADPRTGTWTTSPAGDWTGGFWCGMCWLAAQATGDKRYRDWALQWAERLKPRAQSDTVFRGFLFYYGALLGAVLADDARARAIALAGARGWAASYNAKAGCFPLGAEAEEASNVGHGRGQHRHGARRRAPGVGGPGGPRARLA